MKRIETSWVVSALVVAAGLVLHVWHFSQVTHIPDYPDTRSYLQSAALPLGSSELWVGRDPPVIPLFFKLMGGDRDAITRAQLILTLVAWSALALTAAATMRQPWLRPLACAAVVGLSLTNGIVRWRTVVLSESLAFSLLALLVSVWLLLLLRWSKVRLGALVVLSVAYAFARVTNGFALAGVAGLIFTFLLARQISAENRLRYASIAIFYVALSLASAYTSSAGGRWVPVFYNNVGRRILPYPDRLAEFRDAGMPVNDALLSRKGKWAWDDDGAFFRDPELAEFRVWAREEGRRVYAGFLLRRAPYMLGAPLTAIPALLVGDIPWINRKSLVPLVPHRLARVVFSEAAAMLYVLISLTALVACALRDGPRKRPLFIVAGALLLQTLPGIVLVWHADPMEIVRHALHVVVPARLGFVLLLLFLADHVGGLALPPRWRRA